MIIKEVLQEFICETSFFDIFWNHKKEVPCFRHYSRKQRSSLSQVIFQYFIFSYEVMEFM